MLSRITTRIRRTLQVWSRSRFLVRLFGWKVCEDVDEKRFGFIVIQIDGLSKKHFEKAVESGRMPFLKSLMKEDSHRLVSFYSGIPSTTPAVQAEVMYGQKAVVPSFQFFHPDFDRLVRMVEPSVASSIKKKSLHRPGLLEPDGCSYSNIYGGNADQSLFCIEEMEVDSLVRQLQPWKLFVAIVLHTFDALRMVALSILEAFLSCYSAFKGIFKGKSMGSELKFIPIRVLVCVVLRELIYFLIKLDLARGVSRIHANFFGYDEHSHRRGAGSEFAYWPLKGIDKVIYKIYKRAKASYKCDYHLIIYSDHGQESVLPYETWQGKDFRDATDDFLSQRGWSRRNELDRMKEKLFTGNSFTKEIFKTILGLGKSPQDIQPSSKREDSYEISWMGPISHFYSKRKLSSDEKAKLAEEMVDQLKIPVVYYQQEGGESWAVTSNGVVSVDQVPESLFGKGHPFLHEVAEDMRSLIQHPLSGDLVLSGYLAGQSSVSFANENGAHGGPGPEETHGFALVDSFLDTGNSVYRGMDLYEGLTNPSLENSHHRRLPSQKRSASDLKVITYNIHSAIGMDGKVRIDRVANILRQQHADVIGVQEVDRFQSRSHHVDQAKYLEQDLGMNSFFLPLQKSGDSQYGIQVLSPHPMTVIKAESLDLLNPSTRAEPRGAILVKLQTERGDLYFLNTHLGLSRGERRQQVQLLLGKEWLGDLKEPLVLAGDLNARPGSPEMIPLFQSFHSRPPRDQGGKRISRKTFPSFKPVFELDHIFWNQGATALNYRGLNTRETRVASDHLPVMAELQT